MESEGVSQDLIGLAMESVENEGEPVQRGEERSYVDPAYKRWHKSGFVSVTPAYRIGKILVDIGRTDPETKELILSCVSYLNAAPFIAYLKAIAANVGEDLFTGSNKTLPESFMHYGGTTKDDKPLSRVFKAEWKKRGEDDYDKSTFLWKNGLFNARKTATGALIPDGKPIEATQVMMPRSEIPYLAFELEAEYFAFKVRGENG